MSNTIGYSIPSCSKGERFDFSKSLGNDATGNITTYRISGVRVNALIDLPTAWWPLTESTESTGEQVNTAYGVERMLSSSMVLNGDGRTGWHTRSAYVADYNRDQILTNGSGDTTLGGMTSNGITWMVWVKGITNENYRYIFMKTTRYPDPKEAYEYYLTTYNGGWNCYAKVNGSNYGFVSGSGNSSIGSGWHLLTFRITSNKISVWVDGTKNAEGSEFSGELNASDITIPFRLFGWTQNPLPTGQFQCKGQFQDLMWFNKGVSDETIEWFYNNGVGRIPPELVNFTPGCTVS